MNKTATSSRKRSSGARVGKSKTGASKGKARSFGSKISGGKQSSKKRTGRPAGSFSRGSRGSAQGGRSFGGNRGRGRGGNKRKQQSFDITSFINKSQGIEEAPFVPKNAFEDFHVDNAIKTNLKQKGYTTPTAIQDAVIPHILAKRDVVGLANTGTGKTAAFLIPLIHGLYVEKAGQVLVLTPTRELALQIEEEFKTFSKGMQLFSVVCVGGAPIGPQLQKLRKHNHIIIGTPGRVMDLMKRGALKLGGIQTVVLDEADRMLDMGFINDMRFILEKVPTPRHTLCFSATMSPTIKEIVNDFLNDPVSVSVKTQDTSKNIDQDVVRIAGRDKVEILIEHLQHEDFTKVIVFGRTKHGVEKLMKALNKSGLKTESIHGNKSHGQRQRALKRFKDGDVTALIATDVAARGLDISGVSHVINFDLPETYDDYIHRIGRTGRGEKKGKALTFVG
jgi:ATP-dependent RNA helicase RhlE